MNQTKGLYDPSRVFIASEAVLIKKAEFLNEFGIEGRPIALLLVSAFRRLMRAIVGQSFGVTLTKEWAA
jgi:hypothetical protein